ncbi:MAG: dockerin type I repeat-containing protein [Clostridia bacterium]|nr:dockerin type I repeat-containing protein [Clostridia bacterium]
MRRKMVLSIMSIAMVLVLMMSALPMTVFAANSEGATLIREVSVSGISTPYAGEHPNYSGKLGNSSAYTYGDQIENVPDDFEGKWWFDKTDNVIVKPTDTFEEGHVYTIGILLKSCEGYEFRVDNFDTPFITGYVNGKEATVVDYLTGKTEAMIEYTFEPCEYNYEIKELSVNVTEPVAGGYPDFNIEIETDCVVKDSIDSPYYIYGVAWYDCKTHTFMNPSDPFEEDGLYEVNVVLTTVGDYYFATKNEKTDVTSYINGNEAVTDGAGKNDAYHILVSYVFGDAREEVSYVEVTDVTDPAVGSAPDFDVTPANDTFYINGVFWTDVTNSTEVSVKETDTFKAGHTYELQVWIRANEGYKFSTDEDGCVDIAALVGGQQADVMGPGSEISAELSVTFTLAEPTVVSIVDITEIDAPLEGQHPDYDAYCATQGCNVSAVKWYDVTEGRGTLMNADDVFVAGRSYRVDVLVEAEGEYTFLMSDGYNEAEGYINSVKATAYGSHDETELELGLVFPPCEENPNKPDVKGILGDANEDGTVNIKDATAIQKHIANLITLSEKGLKLADADGNTNVNIKDATAIQKHIAGMDTGFDIGKEI